MVAETHSIDRSRVEKVKRNLFGTPTEDEKKLFHSEYEKTINEERKVMQKKYNFNFRLEIPILEEEEEKYEWDEISASEVPQCFLPRLVLDKKSKATPPRPERRRLTKTMGDIKRRQTLSGLPGRRISLGLIGGNTMNTPNKRLSLKRTIVEEVPEEDSVVSQSDQPKKHRRITNEMSGFDAFKVKRNQRRISDVMDMKVNRASPVVTRTEKKEVLSPKSAAIRKVAELSSVLCPTPDRILTRANSKLLQRTTNRRRTLA